MYDASDIIFINIKVVDCSLLLKACFSLPVGSVRVREDMH